MPICKARRSLSMIPDILKNLKNRCRVQILCICCPGNRSRINNDSDEDETVTPDSKPLLRSKSVPKDLLLNVDP